MGLEDLKKEALELLTKMGFGEEIESVEDFHGTTSRLNIKLIKDSSLLIGERGNNLLAFEHVLKKIVKHRGGEDPKFSVDINEYRMKKLEDIKQDVKTAAKEVRLYRKEVPLRPMSAFERRVVHLLLAEYPDITTESIGEEPARRVVIKPYP